jgi:hypothetical protein
MLVILCVHYKRDLPGMQVLAVALWSLLVIGTVYLCGITSYWGWGAMPWSSGFIESTMGHLLAPSRSIVLFCPFILFAIWHAASTLYRCNAELRSQGASRLWQWLEQHDTAGATALISTCATLVAFALALLVAMPPYWYVAILVSPRALQLTCARLVPCTITTGMQRSAAICTCIVCGFVVGSTCTR